VRHTPTRHHVKTLAVTSSRPNPKTLVAREVLEHPRMVFHPYTCELYGGAATTLIGYNDVRLLPRRPRGGDNRHRLFPLHRRATTLDHCSNSSFTALRA
jgi:hypothetical protein